MVNTCIVCGHTTCNGKSEKNVSMHQFPADALKYQKWLVALKLSEDDITAYSRVCSKHFLHGDSTNVPSLHIGRHFSSPKKSETDHAKRAQIRASRSPSFSSPLLFRPVRKRSSTTPLSSSSVHTPGESTTEDEPMCVSVGEPLLSDYHVHELPLSSSSESKPSQTTLAARVEYLEAETKYLKSQGDVKVMPQGFRVSQIAKDDSLIQFYTGFASYFLFLSFFEFLGPAVYNLKYWGDKDRKTERRRKKVALDPINQYFLTFVRLKLNLRVVDLATRFGISSSLVSKYFITWVCFIYHHLKE